MDRNFVVFLVAVDILILVFGGFLAYADLYMRPDTSRYHENTTLVDVEYSPLAYRPTYHYTEVDVHQEPLYDVVTQGSWTLDFFQISIIVVVVSLLWLLATRQKSDQQTNQSY